MKKVIIAAWLSLCCLHAAGTVQQSVSQLGNTNIWVLAYRWTGDASTGSVSPTAAKLEGCCSGFMITQVETVPGSPAPTNGYSVAIQDAAGVDALNGAAAAASSSTAQSFAASTAAPPVQGTFSLVITGQSVASAKGSVFVFLSKPGTVNVAALFGLGSIASSANWLTIANAPFVDPRSTNFAAQTPGGTLTAATPASVTLRPCPAGVDASHTVAAHLPHLLYIAGVGTPEAVAITGGTGCSIQFTPANSHGAGWTIQSNTDGVQEAVYAAGASGAVRVPAGAINLRGNISGVAALTVPDGYATSLRGMGIGATVFRTGGTTGDWINFDFFSAGAIIDCGDFEMVDNGGVRHTSGSMLKTRYRTDGDVSRIYISFAWDGLIMEGNAHAFYHDIFIDTAHYGFYVTCAGVNYPSCHNQGTVYAINVNSGTANTNAIRIEAPTTGLILDHVFTGTAINNNNASVVIVGIGTGTTNPLNEIIVQNSFLDGHQLGVEIIGNNSAYNTNGIMIQNNRIQASTFGVFATQFVENLTVSNNYIVAITGGAGDRSIILGTDVRKSQFINNQLGSDGDACFVMQGGGSGYSDIDFNGNTCGRQGLPYQPTGAMALAGTIANLNVKNNWLSGTTAGVAGVLSNAATITGLQWLGNTGSVAFPFASFTTCAAGLEGQTAPISDSNTTTWGANIAGGGASHVSGYCNGTNYTVMAK